VPQFKLSRDRRTSRASWDARGRQTFGELKDSRFSLSAGIRWWAKQRRGGFASTQALPPAPLPLQLPPAAAGVAMAVSTLLPVLVRRLGLPLLGAAALIPLRLRRSGPFHPLIVLDSVPLVVPDHCPLIPLLRLRGPFHLASGLSLPLVPLLDRRRAFHPLFRGRLPWSIALRAPLNLCGCRPPGLGGPSHFARRFIVWSSSAGGAHNAVAPELARAGCGGNVRPSAVFTRPLRAVGPGPAFLLHLAVIGPDAPRACRRKFH